MAAVVAPPPVPSFRGNDFVREKYPGAKPAFPAGIAIPVVALFTLIPLSLLAQLADADVFPEHVGIAFAYVTGVALLGLLDDLVGSDMPARGWRGHARAAARGGLTTGVIKAAGPPGPAPFAAYGLRPGAGGPPLA